MSADTVAPPAPALTRKDFISDQMVRWCPGCGDYSILAQVQKTFPDFNLPKEKFVFVSGIGCSSRFPYYMDTYGFHTIHGRGTAVATGVKLANPDLSVWVVTGDGDSMSIGGNHFIHLLRRNLDINLMMFNNRIYGLTKGQYSPTSEKGKVTKSSPFGSLDHAFNPPALALGAASTFIARSLDVDAKHLQTMIKAAYDHVGTSFLEIYQNCHIFNDNAFDDYSDKETKGIRQLLLEDGQPMVFGPERNLGIRFDGHRPQVVDLTNGKWSLDDLAVHDKTDKLLALMLCDLTYQPEFPTPFGVIYQVEKVSYETQVYQQIDDAISKLGAGDLKKLLKSGHTWTVD
ncbi:MAG: 2-oxoacid:ferredoxin oxidoreductase subunit beta [Candidatus Marinimicrobia bacterium]|nr:2-oxoacid:ferredoxin oxidoreductase subunit beta [Candidatus Neomarinimicrobiota bacterium]